MTRAELEQNFRFAKDRLATAKADSHRANQDRFRADAALVEANARHDAAAVALATAVVDEPIAAIVGAP